MLLVMRLVVSRLCFMFRSIFVFWCHLTSWLPIAASLLFPWPVVVHRSLCVFVYITHVSVFRCRKELNICWNSKYLSYFPQSWSMTMSRVIVGDSNVDHFWTDALSDRKEMKAGVSLIRVTKLDQVDVTFQSISTGNVVVSCLTNLIVDHVESIGPMSTDNLIRSTSTILDKFLDDALFPLCFRLKESKVEFVHKL